jgi:hypothetical protein
MKLEIITKGSTVEKVNYLLSLAHDAAFNNEQFREINEISLKDLEQIELFRTKMLNAYFKNFKSNEKKT